MDERVVMFRCSECGKWSHAKKMPKTHRRFVRRDEDGEGLPDGAVVVEEQQPWVSGEGESDEGGWWIACGPFVTYEAERVP